MPSLPILRTLGLGMHAPARLCFSASALLLILASVCSHAVLSQLESIAKKDSPHGQLCCIQAPSMQSIRMPMSAQVSSRDRQQSQAGTNSGKPMSSPPSRKASTPSKEQFQPDQLLLAWIQHQLKLSMSRRSEAPWPGAAAQRAGRQRIRTSHIWLYSGCKLHSCTV